MRKREIAALLVICGLGCQILWLSFRLSTLERDLTLLKGHRDAVGWADEQIRLTDAAKANTKSPRRRRDELVFSQAKLPVVDEAARETGDGSWGAAVSIAQAAHVS